MHPLLLLPALLLSTTALAQAPRHLCQGRVCWQENARPAWLDRATASYEGSENPVLANGRLEGHAILRAPPGLDARTCTFDLSWRGARRGPHGEREPITGELHGGPPTRVDPGSEESVAHFASGVALPGTELILEVYGFVTCGTVSFSLSSTDDLVSTTDVLPLLCALRPPPRTPRSVHERLPDGVRSVRIAARYGAVLRRRGHVLVDACTGRDLVDLDALGVPIASIAVPELGALTYRDRYDALWGATELRSGSASTIRTFHGFNGEWLGFVFARPPTPGETARVRTRLAAIPALAWVDTMEDVPQP